MISRKSLILLLATFTGAAAIVYANVPDQPFMEAARADLLKARAEVQETHRPGNRRSQRRHRGGKLI